MNQIGVSIGIVSPRVPSLGVECPSMLNWEKRGSGRVIEKEMKFRFGMFLNPFWGPFQGISGDIRRCRKWSKQGEGQRTSLVGLIDRPSFVPGSWALVPFSFHPTAIPYPMKGATLARDRHIAGLWAFVPVRWEKGRFGLWKDWWKPPFLSSAYWSHLGSQPKERVKSWFLRIIL